jgi:hypothetical protein
VRFSSKLFSNEPGQSQGSLFPDLKARWQSGHAAACKAVYAGSIPTLASNNSQGGAPGLAAARQHQKKHRRIQRGI